MNEPKTNTPHAEPASAQPASLMRYGGELFEAFFHSAAEQFEANGGLSGEKYAELATYLQQTNNPEILAKRDRLAEFLARLDCEAEAIRTEEKRLATRRAGFEKISACMRNSIYQQMLDSGINRIEGKLCSFSIRKNPPRVEIVDEEAIPPEFIDYTPTVNKAVIKSALEDGKQVPGAELVQTTRLDIR
jgi:hypothetical protein